MYHIQPETRVTRPSPVGVINVKLIALYAPQNGRGGGLDSVGGDTRVRPAAVFVCHSGGAGHSTRGVINVKLAAVLVVTAGGGRMRLDSRTKAGCDVDSSQPLFFHRCGGRLAFQEIGLCRSSDSQIVVGCGRLPAVRIIFVLVQHPIFR